MIAHQPPPLVVPWRLAANPLRWPSWPRRGRGLLCSELGVEATRVSRDGKGGRGSVISRPCSGVAARKPRHPLGLDGSGRATRARSKETIGADVTAVAA